MKVLTIHLLTRYKYLLGLIILTLFSFQVNGQRKVLVEQFTNSGCPNCASNTPVIASYVNSNLNTVLMLAYHTPFPYNDSMYYENAFQSDQRVSYYNVGGVPNSRVDGIFFAGNLVPTMNTTITNAAAVTPRYSISFSSAELNGNDISASILFESDDSNNLSENLSAYVVVTERNVLKSSYVCCPGANSENEYPWVVRRMLPNENGTVLMNKGLGGMDLVNVSWIANNFKDLLEMRVVAFVQNNTTKAVYQAEISTPVNTTGIFLGAKTEKNIFSVVNPVRHDLLTLNVMKSAGQFNLKVYNVLGKIVYTQSIDKSGLHQVNVSHVNEGLYFVQMENDQYSQLSRVLIKH